MMDEDTVVYLHNFAIFCLRYGRFEDARPVFQLLDTLQPGDRSVLLGLAKSNLELGDTVAAIECLNRIGSLAPGDPDQRVVNWLKLVASGVQGTAPPGEESGAAAPGS